MSSKLDSVLSAIDLLNAQDPISQLVDGQPMAKELLYSQRMSACLDNFSPNASDELKIAARAQHVQRWKSPRSDYPLGKAGYYKWRQSLAKMHAETAADLMLAAGYADSSIELVRQLLTKKGIKEDERVQTLEDVICLVFLEFYYPEFAEKHDDAKVIDILQKTWKKMSPHGQSKALELVLDDGDARRLLEEALR